MSVPVIFAVMADGNFGFDEQCFPCFCYKKIVEAGMHFVDIEVGPGPLGVQFRWKSEGTDGLGIWIRTIQANSQIATNGIVQAGDRLVQVGNKFDKHAPRSAIEPIGSVDGSDGALAAAIEGAQKGGSSEVADAEAAQPELVPCEPVELLAELTRATRPVTLRFLLAWDLPGEGVKDGQSPNSKSVEQKKDTAPVTFSRTVKCVNIMGVPYMDCMYDRTEGCCSILGSRTPTTPADAPSKEKVPLSMNGHRIHASVAPDELDGVIYGETVDIVAARSHHILVHGPGKQLRWLPIVNEAAVAAVERAAPVRANATRNFLYQPNSGRVVADTAGSLATAHLLNSQTPLAGGVVADVLAQNGTVSVSEETLREASQFVHENIDHWRELAEGRTSDVPTDRDLPSRAGGKHGKANWFDQVKSWLANPKARDGKKQNKSGRKRSSLGTPRAIDSSSMPLTGSSLAGTSPSHAAAVGVGSRRNSGDLLPLSERLGPGIRVQVQGLTGKRAQFNNMPAEVIWTTDSETTPITRVRLLGTPAVYGREIDIPAENLVALSRQLEKLPGFSSHGFDLGNVDAHASAAEARQHVDQAERARMRRSALRVLLDALEAEGSSSARANTRRVWLKSCLDFCFDGDDFADADESEKKTDDKEPDVEGAQFAKTKEGGDEAVGDIAETKSPLASHVHFYRNLGNNVEQELEQKMDELAQARFTFPASAAPAMAKRGANQASSAHASTQGSAEVDADRAARRSESLGVIVRDVHRTYPEHFLFQERGGRGQRMLARVLAVASEYDPELSYCQGMNFIAGMLLTVFVDADAVNGLDAAELEAQLRSGSTDAAATAARELAQRRADYVRPGTLEFGEQCAFWVMAALMESPRHRMRRCFIPGLPQIELCLVQFQLTLERLLPELNEHMETLSADSNFVMRPTCVLSHCRNNIAPGCFSSSIYVSVLVSHR